MINPINEVKAGYRSEIGRFVKSCIGDWQDSPESAEARRQRGKRIGIDSLTALTTPAALGDIGLDERTRRSVLALNGVAIRYRMFMESTLFKFFLTRAQVGKDFIVGLSNDSLDDGTRHGADILSQAGAYAMSTMNKHRAGMDVDAGDLDTASVIFGAYHAFSHMLHRDPSRTSLFDAAVQSRNSDDFIEYVRDVYTRDITCLRENNGAVFAKIRQQSIDRKQKFYITPRFDLGIDMSEGVNSVPADAVFDGSLISLHTFESAPADAKVWEWIRIEACHVLMDANNSHELHSITLLLPRQCHVEMINLSDLLSPDYDRLRKHSLSLDSSQYEIDSLIDAAASADSATRLAILRDLFVDTVRFAQAHDASE